MAKILLQMNNCKYFKIVLDLNLLILNSNKYTLILLIPQINETNLLHYLDSLVIVILIIFIFIYYICLA